MLGLGDLAVLSDPATALPALVLVDVWEWMPFMFLVVLAGLQGLPSEPLEAAQMDGAGPARRFWTITLPLLRPLIGVALLIRTIDALTTFDQIFVLTRGGPGNSTEVLSLYAYNTAFKFSQMGYAAAMIVAVVAVLAVSAAAASAMLRRTAARGVR